MPPRSTKGEVPYLAACAALVQAGSVSGAIHLEMRLAALPMRVSFSSSSDIGIVARCARYSST